MKGMVALLVLLTAAKVGYSEYLTRTAATDIIIAAYRDRAIAACQRDGRAEAIVAASAWLRPDAIRLAIGKSSLDVYIWQTGHPLWLARFKNPYLFLEVAGREGTALCEFDIVHGATSVIRI